MLGQLRAAQQIHWGTGRQLRADSRLPYSVLLCLSSKPSICCSQEGKEAAMCAESEPHRHSNCALLKYVKLNSTY